MNRIIPRMVTPLLLALAVITGKATASTVIYDLELNNLTQFTGQTLARVTLTDKLGGGVDFTVDPLIPGTKVDQFAFNFLTDSEPAGLSIAGLVSGWTYNVAIDAVSGFNGYGKFDVNVSNNNGFAGRLSQLSFSVSVGVVADYVALSDKGESSLFSAHIADLNSNGSGACGSDGCTAVTGYAGGGTLVPVPSAVWLFGSGLIGLAGIARRKKAA